MEARTWTRRRRSKDTRDKGKTIKAGFRTMQMVIKISMQELNGKHTNIGLNITDPLKRLLPHLSTFTFENSHWLSGYLALGLL